MHVFLPILKWTLAILLIGALAGFLFLHCHPIFGGKPDAASMARIQASPQFNGEVFVNEEKTYLSAQEDVGEISLIDWLRSVIYPPAGKHPKAPLPTLPVQADTLQNGEFIWLGHSSLLAKLEDKTLLFDPVFNRASPVPVAGKPFAMTHPPRADDMPAIDAALISHDHYDHLDYYAVKALDKKIHHFYVPLGVKAHLVRWGIADTRITEMDWHDSAQIGDITITLAPARHFSGRRFDNRGSSLWGSWVIKPPQTALYFNADSGYGKHFRAIGGQYGPFDFAFMENGMYDDRWAQIHMTPEESVQAAQDLGAKAVMPIHWGKYDLAYHTWRDPADRFIAAAQQQGIPTATPKIGQTFTLDNLPVERWWRGLE